VQFILLKFAEMLESIGKYVGFLTITGLTAFAIFLQYYRKKAEVKSAAGDVEVIEVFSFFHSFILFHSLCISNFLERTVCCVTRKYR